jgi:DNA-binding transcriptional ArsR family regulator
MVNHSWLEKLGPTLEDMGFIERVESRRRRKILELLKGSAVSEEEIMSRFRFRSPVAYHLRVLKELGMITEVKEEGKNKYVLNEERIREMNGFLKNLL